MLLSSGACQILEVCGTLSSESSGTRYGAVDGQYATMAVALLLHGSTEDRMLLLASSSPGGSQI
jgi:hypothetical protein